MKPEHTKSLEQRVARQRAFHAGSEPGDLLVYGSWSREPSLEAFLCKELFERPAAEVLGKKNVDEIIDRFVRDLRASFDQVYALDDDTVPSAFVYAGIGVINATITGLDPVHDEVTSWLEPSLNWEELDRLRFDPDGKWVQFALHCNRALWRRWEEDFFILPFLHRSPLDAANGIRGNELFAEMYTDPEKVKRLVNWCADWSITLERFLAEERRSPDGWGTAIWSTWLPDGGVFVNGDPVGLISREMMRQFEQPYTAKLFTTLGGGFFHSHTIGVYQVDQVAQTEGLLVQEFVPDPKVPNLPELLLNDDRMRETILAASLDSPIMIEDVPPDRIDELLPIVRRGRFILRLSCPEGADNAEIIRKVRAASNIK